MSRIIGRLAVVLPLLLAGSWALWMEPPPLAEGGTRRVPLLRRSSAFDQRSQAQPLLALSASSGTRTTNSLRAAPRYVGVNSCAASNCHGGGSLETIEGSEYSIWIQQDDHALAYTVLYNDESAQIIRNLKASPTYEDIKPAYEEHRCLVCHATGPHPSFARGGTEVTLQDGVGCEACHGPSERWLEPHKRPEWQSWSVEQKAELGFRDTKDLLTRARLCADCHVGAPGRDVNHDLIAAGHPRLNFELNAYQALMPAHWDRNEDRRRHALTPRRPRDGSKSASGGHQPPGDTGRLTPAARQLRAREGRADDPADVKSYLEAKLWLLGQATAAEAALQLLETRAAHETAPWPEFAEYGCFACHHDLQADSWRQRRGYEGRRPGDYPWGTWTFPVLTWLSQETDGPNLLADDGAFRQLRGTMGTSYPDREAVRAHASALKKELAEWAERVNRQELSVNTLQELLQGLASDGQTLTPQHWDAAAQVYLAVVALNQGYADAQGRIGPGLLTKDQEINKSLEEIRKHLVFPVEERDQGGRIEYESPKTFGPDRVEGINDHLSRIQNLVE